MRKGLQKLDGQRRTFAGTFERYGSKTSYRGPPKVTLLFSNICDSSGREVADHVWFTETQGFKRLGTLEQGCRVQFDARVTEYTKGYRGRREDVWMDNPPRTDYRLSYPTKVKKVI